MYPNLLTDQAQRIAQTMRLCVMLAPLQARLEAGFARRSNIGNRHVVDEVEPPGNARL